MEIATLVISIVSLCLVLGLYCRTTKSQNSVANRDREALELVANLVINAAYDPDTVRRLIVDYDKEKRWRAGIFYTGDKHHSLAYKMPEPDTITIGDLQIAIVRQPIKNDNIPS